MIIRSGREKKLFGPELQGLVVAVRFRERLPPLEDPLPPPDVGQGLGFKRLKKVRFMVLVDIPAF